MRAAGTYRAAKRNAARAERQLPVWNRRALRVSPLPRVRRRPDAPSAHSEAIRDIAGYSTQALYPFMLNSDAVARLLRPGEVDRLARRRRLPIDHA